METFLVALAAASYVLVGVRVAIVARAGFQPLPLAFILGTFWPASMAIVGIVTPLTGWRSVFDDH